MKRILIIDESEVVRETLALILEREFAVVKRPLGSREFAVADPREHVDLLIFGVTPQLGAEATRLSRFAAQLPFAVLFLVDSKSIAKTIETALAQPARFEDQQRGRVADDFKATPDRAGA